MVDHNARDEFEKSRSRHGLAQPFLLAGLAVAGVLLVVGIAPRLARQAELNRVHGLMTNTVPQIKAVVVQRAPEETSLTLPGDTQPIQSIPIYARVNGYIAQRYVDIGDNVKAGQLLATIDTPELDQQVQQAEANVRMAQASLASSLSDRQNYAAQLYAADATIKQSRTNLEYSSTEARRYQSLALQGALSYEQRDQALKQYNSDTAAIQINQNSRQALLAQVAGADARIAAAKQTVESNQANLRQLRAMQSFQKVVAPADGVITNRFVDAGNLVAAGGATGTTELLAMAKTDVLRIYVDVPQTDYRYIHSGDKALILLQEFPGQKFVGTVTNISGQLNSNSRTLQTEIQFDNKAHVLKPGAYADVQFVYKNTNPPLIIPSNAAVTKNDGLYVAVSTDKKVRFQKIDVSRDRGNELEVRQGIKAGQIALLDPPDSLSDGSIVNPVIATASTQQGEQVSAKAESERGETSDKDRSGGDDKPAASKNNLADNK